MNKPPSRIVMPVSPAHSLTLPAIIADAGEPAARRFLEFFTAHIRNPNTRQAGIATRISNHTFRATGITAYLNNDGKLEHARQMAAHASTRTTQLYDRRSDEVALDEVERIVI